MGSCTSTTSAYLAPVSHSSFRYEREESPSKKSNIVEPGQVCSENQQQRSSPSDGSRRVLHECSSQEHDSLLRFKGTNFKPALLHRRIIKCANVPQWTFQQMISERNASHREEGNYFTTLKGSGIRVKVPELSSIEESSIMKKRASSRAKATQLLAVSSTPDRQISASSQGGVN